MKGSARAQIKEGVKIARTADRESEARRKVLSYALDLPEDDPLKCHVEDRLWGSYSKTALPVAEPPKRRTRSGVLSGGAKRMRKIAKGGLLRGSPDDLRLHRGRDAALNVQLENQARAKSRQSRPAVAKRPASTL